MNKNLKKILDKLSPEDLALAEKGCKIASNYTLEKMYNHYCMFGESPDLAKDFEEMIPGYIVVAKQES